MSAVLVRLLAYTGIRPQEALALHWYAVRDRTLLVELANADGELDRLKNRKRSRTVGLVKPLAEDLQAWRRDCGTPADGELLFPHETYGGLWLYRDDVGAHVHHLCVVDGSNLANQAAARCGGPAAVASRAMTASRRGKVVAEWPDRCGMYEPGPVRGDTLRLGRAGVRAAVYVSRRSISVSSLSEGRSCWSRSSTPVCATATVVVRRRCWRKRR